MFEGPQIIAFQLVILLFSVVVHEVMHGLVALKFGDHTAERAGRLTLNPIPHIDPIGTLLVPAMLFIIPAITGVRPGFFIGWAKPVPVNPLHFTDIRKGELMVSLAGALSNLGLAIIAAVLFRLVASFSPNYLIMQVLEFAVSINLMLGIFNLLPIPPLDGSKVLLSQLPYKAAREFERLSQYGFIILIALLYFGVIGVILNLIVTPLQNLLLGY